MARIRTIKPEFFTSEDITELSSFARLLYIATWCEADREGRLTWKPKTFKLRYFPGDSVDIDALCKELIDLRLVVLYGDGLAHIPKFLKHQHINAREAASALPVPDASTTRQSRVNNTSRHVTDVHGGREGKEHTNASLRVASFERFWEAYPKKRSKGDAEKAWKKLKPEDALVEVILQAIESEKLSADWQKDGGQYIPYPASWLNGKRWQDEAGGVNGTLPVWEQ